MKNILIDTILYNPMIFVYNISESVATVYNDIDKKVLTLQIKLNKTTNDKYITINRNTYYLKYMFDLSNKYS